MSDTLCQRCGLPTTPGDVDGVHVCPKKTRKPRAERQRNLIHFLLNDADYIRLLELSGGRPLSEFCREAVQEKLDRIAEDERHPG